MRVTRHHAAIRDGLARYPESLLRIVPAFWTDDPIWTGLHNEVDTTGDGRSYADTAHTCYPWHTRHQIPIVVLPKDKDTHLELVRTVVHEVAHVLDWQTGFRHDLPALNWYAATNRQEAFAEAVTAWLMPDFDDTGWLNTKPIPSEVHDILQNLT